MLASGGGDIKLWNMHTGKLVRTFSGHTGFVLAIAFNPDGQTLASSSGDVKLWNLQTGELINTFSEHSGDVNSITFSSDGKTLISGSKDETIQISRQ